MTQDTDVNDSSDTERKQRVRQQCPECNLLFNIGRITVTDDGIRCLECAGEDSEPWYVPSDAEHTENTEDSDR